MLDLDQWRVNQMYAVAYSESLLKNRFGSKATTIKQNGPESCIRGCFASLRRPQRRRLLGCTDTARAWSRGGYSQEQTGGALCGSYSTCVFSPAVGFSF